MNDNARIRNLLAGILGAAAGGILGYFAFFWIAGQGFYALMVPGGLVGLGDQDTIEAAGRIGGNREVVGDEATGNVALLCAAARQGNDPPDSGPWRQRAAALPRQDAPHAGYDSGDRRRWD